MEQINLREPLHILRCLGQLAMWGVQDILRAPDDAIVELPDYE